MTTLSEYSVGELVEKCIHNDKHAQGVLFHKYYPVLFGLLYRYTSSMEDAEDLLQETYVKIFTTIKTLKNPEAVEGWMKKVAVNTALTFLKKKKKLADLHKILPTDVEEENDHIDWLTQISSEQLHQRISELPPGYRTVINLYAIEGYSHQQISEALGISENTSRTQYMKAKGILKKKLLVFKQSDTQHER